MEFHFSQKSNAKLLAQFRFDANPFRMAQKGFSIGMTLNVLVAGAVCCERLCWSGRGDEAMCQKVFRINHSYMFDLQNECDDDEDDLHCDCNFFGRSKLISILIWPGSLWTAELSLC